MRLMSIRTVNVKPFYGTHSQGIEITFQICDITCEEIASNRALEGWQQDVVAGDIIQAARLVGMLS